MANQFCYIHILDYIHVFFIKGLAISFLLHSDTFAMSNINEFSLKGYTTDELEAMVETEAYCPEDLLQSAGVEDKGIPDYCDRLAVKCIKKAARNELVKRPHRHVRRQLFRAIEAPSSFPTQTPPPLVVPPPTATSSSTSNLILPLKTYPKDVIDLTKDD